MQSLQKELAKSSGSINSLLHRLSAQKEGELGAREDALGVREAGLAERTR